MRIGFVLADLFTGVSVSLWPSVASMFRQKGEDCLVLFSGGRIRSAANLEKMRSNIYRLVNSENLDGSIIWCSSLTGKSGTEEVLSQFPDMLSLPMVTIDGKTARFPEIPDIRFNAYDGSKAMIEHCIRKHGSRRIAYVRAPENHNSANERFKAYLDVLEENGIQVDQSIITDHFPWNAGAQAIGQLLDQRGKVPGKDFDTILFASDLMMYTAVQELLSLGYRIPDDIIVCGFNDSLESRLLSVPVTTVRLPYAGLGMNAALMFNSLVEKGSCSDKVLRTTPIFRGSCGCGIHSEIPSQIEFASISEAISSNFPISLSDARFLIDRVFRNPSESNIRSLLETLCTNGADVYEMNMVMDSLLSIPSMEEVDRKLVQDTTMEILPYVLDRNTSIVSYEAHSRRNAFNRFNNELLEANTVADISRIVERNAPELGFEKIHIILSDGEKSQLVGSDSSFSDNLLVPEDSGIIDNGIWVASPLCTESEYMGHILMKLKDFNGSVCEEVRSVVSSALRNSMLFEATIKAQQTAEKAEQARTTFFANVGENLRDPLSDIVDIVSSSVLDPESKKSIIDRITGANQILDLALSSTGELELDRYTMSLDSLLSSFPCYRRTMPLPCIVADENRLKQALETIVGSMGDDVTMTAEMGTNGIRVELDDTKGSWTSDSGDVSQRLAQRILFMHNGTFSVDGSRLTIVLPYPSLSGSGTGQWGENENLACLGDRPDFSIPGVTCMDVNANLFSEKKRLPPMSGAIYWDPGFKGYNALSSLLCLVSNENYRNMPFICMDCPRSRTLEDAIRSSIEEKGRVVLQVGSASEDLYRWLQDPNVLSCEISNAAQMCRKHEPGFVIVMMEDPTNTISSVVSFLKYVRGNGKISQTPVILCSDNVDDAFVKAVGDIPNVILINSCMLESEEFAMRVRAILGGSPLLATPTGVIVKKAQAYICTHSTLQLNRWQVAANVNVSEDYLTRIFKKELGLSPWDYLNRYKVWLAGRLLRNTGMSVNEVSIATGFQDQAYFCRVFKKIKGYSPSRLRSARKSEMSKSQ